MGIDERWGAGVRWRHQVTTEADTEPVTLAQAKAHVRYTGSDTDEEAKLTRLIVAARRLAEEMTGRAYHTKTIKLYLDRFPSRRFLLLPYPPLQSVTSIEYYDADGALQTVSSSNYVVSTHDEPGRVDPIATYSWPATYARPGAVIVTYVAGYSTSGGGPAQMAADRAESIEGIYLLIGHWYRNAEATSDRAQVALPMAVADSFANDSANPHLMEAMR